MAAVNDIIFSMECLYKESIATGNMEKAHLLAEVIREYQEPECEEILKNAERRFRSSKYPHIKYARLMTDTITRPVTSLTMELSPAAAKVFLYLAQTAVANYARVSSKVIAENTKLSSKTVSKSVGELIETGILEVSKAREGPNPPVYRWNPAVLQVGKWSEVNFEDVPGRMKTRPAYIPARKKLPATADGKLDFVVVYVPTGDDKE